MLLNEHVFFTDGGCQNNNKKNADRRMQICVSDYQGNILIFKTSEGGSNNLAEFMAIKECLLYAKEHDIRPLHIYTDSTNNFHWWKKVTNHAPTTAKELKSEIADLRDELFATLSWVPREYNLAGKFLEKAPWY